MSKKRKIRICLYSVITEENQNRPVERTLFQRAKNGIWNIISAIKSNYSGNIFLDEYHSRKIENTNKGDISIRLSICERIFDIFANFDVDIRQISWGSLNDESVRDININTDIFIIAGGGYIFLNSDGTTNTRMDDVKFLKSISCKKVAYSIGLNRLNNETIESLSDISHETSEKIRQFSRSVDLLSVRDNDSLDLFIENGCKNVIRTADPALFLRSKIYNGAIRKKANGITVGINMACHGRNSIGMLEKSISSYVEFLKHINSTHSVYFVYFVHDDIERRIPNYLRSHGIHCDVVDCGPRALIDAYRQVDIVINQMLHSCILAFNAETPILNISYDKKSHAFLNLFELSDLFIPCVDVNREKLILLFEKILENRNNIVEKIRRGKIKLAQDMERFDHSLSEIAEAASHNLAQD